MPQYNAPALITSLVGSDIILVWQTSSGAVKTMTGQNLANSLQALMSANDVVSVLSVSTILTTQQFAVGNSGSPITFTMPDSASNPGMKIRIANKGASVLTVARAGADTIGGATSVTLAQWSGATYESDGQGVWFQV